jgi:hypothetical protein
MIEAPKELKLVVLQHNSIVRFTAMDSSLGRAEFRFCPIWKRGKIQSLFIYHIQQRDVESYYRIDSGYSTALRIGSWTHKGIEEAHPWLHFWCKDHKCMSFRAYVPPRSTNFRVSVVSTLAIDFDL